MLKQLRECSDLNKVHMFSIQRVREVPATN